MLLGPLSNLHLTIFYFVVFWSACCSFSVIFSLQATMQINVNLKLATVFLVMVSVTHTGARVVAKSPDQ